MQARYCFLLTVDELHNLSAATKKELAELDGEFARLVGVPTAANPPEQPSNPRPTMQQGATTVILPDRNQPNQQNSPAYNAALSGGIPGISLPSPAAPPAGMVQPVPSAMPFNTGIPQAPQQPQQMVMPPMQQIPGIPQPAPQQVSPALTPPMLPTPPLQPMQQPAQQMQPVVMQASDLQYIKTNFVVQQTHRLGPHGITQAINQAVQRGILPRPSLDCVDANNAAAFVQYLQTYTG
jgi:hypothetical protein